MKKNFVLPVLFLLLMICPFFNVNAESKTVNNLEDLQNALANKDITEIILGDDILSTEKINITREITIDGQGHTIKYVGGFGDGNDYTTWKGIYVLHVYKTTATIKNIKLTGGNAALLVNGSKVHLVGTIDVSGNGFGGIELGQGVDVNETVHLELDETTNIVNTTESSKAPTLWVPSDSDAAIIEQDGMQQVINPGEEITEAEIEAYFEEVVNPETSDNIGIYVILLGLGLLTLHLSVNKFIKD